MTASSRAAGATGPQHPPSGGNGRGWRLGDRFVLALGAIFVLAFVVRLAPLLRTGSMTGVLGPDDGTHFAMSAHLLHGELPYRDVVFGHPPGISVLLLPFAASSTVTGDAAALAASRLAFVVLGALNAVLIGLLLRRLAPAWAIAGGLLYAVWRLPAAAERTVLPETLLTFGLLTALLVLGSPRGAVRPGRAIGSGLLLGLALATTWWAAPVILLVGAFVAVTRGLRTATAWCGAAALGFAALAGPFILAAPGSFLQQTLGDHALSATNPTRSERLRRYAELVRLGAYEVPASVEVMLATCVIVGLSIVAVTAWSQPGARPFALLAALNGVLIAIAPTAGFHRVAIAPVAVVLLAVAAQQLVPRPRQAPKPYLVGGAAAGGVALAALAVTAVHNVVPRTPDLTALRAFAAAHPCAWFETASQAIAADALTPQVDHRCPTPVDRFAEFRHLGVPAASHRPDTVRYSAQAQDRLRAELSMAEAAVVAVRHDLSLLAPATRDDLDDRFERVGDDGNVRFWTRRS